MIRYRLNGREVTRDEFLANRRWRPGDVPLGAPSRGWPILSDAMGVHPSQIQEAMAFDARHGVPTEYTPDGRPILLDRWHRKRYAEAHGFYDRNGGYGDPQPKHG